MVVTSTEIKAARVLAKLYLMRKVDFLSVSVKDICDKATPEQIDFYYYWLCR